MFLLVYLYAYLTAFFMPLVVLAQAVPVIDGLDKTTPLENWQYIAGAVLPFFLSFVMQSNWSRTTQTLVTMGASILVSIIAALLTDPAFIVPEVIIRAIGLFALTVSIYMGAYKPTKVAQKIEAATNVTEEARSAAALKAA